jgi:FKBP-type peptidyl-prolyl cis-trans isomerase SlyD
LPYLAAEIFYIMQIAPNKVVAITYTLKEEGASEVIETVSATDPFYFLFGSGNLLPAFEEALSGLEVGNHFDFILPAENAYGLLDETAVVDLPISIFMIDGRFAEEYVVVGEMIQLQDNQGNPLMGKVLNRGLETVTIDFNHPMAGKSLHFVGAVQAIRDASSEELEHGHAHSPNMPHH